MNQFKRALITGLVVCLGIVPMAFAEARAELPTKALEKAPGTFDRVAFANEMTSLQGRLAAERVATATAAPLVIDVSESDLNEISNDVTAQQKMKVGVVRETYVPVSFTGPLGPKGVDQIQAFGSVRTSDDAFIFSGDVISPNAAALRVHFTDFDMPEGSEMFVYNSSGMAFGPYTGQGPNGTGDFWTNTIVGEELTIQVYGRTGDAPGFVIAGIGHLTSELQIAATLAPSPQAAQPNCSFNESCVVGASCVANNGAVSTAKDAVAHILFASGGFLYICSGGLVADSDTSSSIPYFVTANHCISKGGEASSLETFFFYTASCGSCPDPGSPSTNGSSIVSSNRTSDYTILRLSQNAPSGAAFLGWDPNPIANTDNAPLYRLSHPKGAPQSYSEHVVDTSKPTCRSWPRGDWIYSRDVLGATEGGSSGSPVVNGAGQLVGQLSGACGFNVNDVCDTASNATVDGAFAAYYSAVSSFLGSGDGGGDGGGDDGGTCTDADGDGWCVEDGDCDDNNNKVYPGANDTKGKWGRDGVDNDCNGVIDG